MIIKSLLLQPLGPALVLALGAALLALGRRIGAWQISRLGAFRRPPGAPSVAEPLVFRLRFPAALLMLFMAGLVLVLLRDPAARPALQWTWQPLTVAGSLLDWRMDGWSWLVGLLILSVAAAAVALAELEPPRARADDPTPASWLRLDRAGTATERTLWLAAAALVFASSANVVTLAGGWILLDAALALRLRAGTRSEPVSRAWGLLSLTGVLLLFVLALLGEGGIRSELTGRVFDRWELALLWLAGLVRAGVYPLHFWLIGPGHSDRGERMALGVLGPLTGLRMLGRLQAASPPDWLQRPEWAALGAFALLGTALVAWTQADEGWRWRWIALNRATVVVLAAYMTGSSGPEALSWMLVTFGLGTALLAVSQAAYEHLGWRAPAWLAALALWGLPGTPGFLARYALVYPTDLPVAIPLFGIIILAEILLVAALWQAVQGTSREARPWPLRLRGSSSGNLPKRSSINRRMTVGLGVVIALLAVPLLAWGLMPQRLALLVGWPASDIFPSLRLALTSARKSVWAGLALSGALGVFLGVLRNRIFGQMAGWQRGISAIVGLDWLYQILALGLDVIASGLQYFSRLGEGEGYLGWLALAGLILWVLLRG